MKVWSSPFTSLLFLVYGVILSWGIYCSPDLLITRHRFILESFKDFCFSLFFFIIFRHFCYVVSKAAFFIVLQLHFLALYFLSSLFSSKIFSFSIFILSIFPFHYFLYLIPKVFAKLSLTSIFITSFLRCFYFSSPSCINLFENFFWIPLILSIVVCMYIFYLLSCLY